jgi:hypothetical protein
MARREERAQERRRRRLQLIVQLAEHDLQAGGFVAG